MEIDRMPEQVFTDTIKKTRSTELILRSFGKATTNRRRLLETYKTTERFSHKLSSGNFRRVGFYCNYVVGYATTRQRCIARGRY